MDKNHNHTFEPQAPEPPAPATAPAPPAGRSWKGVMLAALLVIVAALLAFWAYTTWFAAPAQNANKGNENQTTTQKQPAATPLTPADIVKAIKPQLQNPEVATKKQFGSTAFGPDDQFTYGVSAFKPNGYDFVTLPKEFTGIAAKGAQSKAEADLQSIKTYLSQQGFAHTDTTDTSYTGMIYSADFSTDSIRCNVVERQLAAASDYQTAVGCATVASYTEMAKTLQPLFTVYAAATKVTAGSTISFSMSQPEPKASQTAGYKIAYVNASEPKAGGATAAFYQTPDNTWHYFKSSQQALPCEAYNTPDLKKAFLGESCYAAGGESSVRL